VSSPREEIERGRGAEEGGAGRGGVMLSSLSSMTSDSVAGWFGSVGFSGEEEKLQAGEGEEGERSIPLPLRVGLAEGSGVEEETGVMENLRSGQVRSVRRSEG
jgi:hypothetical protein